MKSKSKLTIIFLALLCVAATCDGPAATPMSTPTPTSYEEAIVDVLEQYALALTAHADLVRQSQEDPGLWADADWQAEMATVQARLLVCGLRVRELEPPYTYLATHAQIVAASIYFDAAVAAFETGDYAGAAEELRRGGEAIDAAKLEVLRTMADQA